MNTLTQTLHMLSNVNQYTRWQYRTIEPYIGKRILEVGCGIGTMTGLLLQNRFVVAMDYCPQFIGVVESIFRTNNNIKPMIGDIRNESILNMANYNFDTVVCLNVIEHIENDALVLKNMYNLLQDGGKVIILVPAVPFIYGTIDKHMGHFRRYTKKGLCSKLINSNFKIEKCFYFNFIGAIGWFISSKILKKRIIPEGQAMFVDRITPILSFYESLFKPPLGLSLLAIGSK